MSENSASIMISNLSWYHFSEYHPSAARLIATRVSNSPAKISYNFFDLDSLAFTMSQSSPKLIYSNFIGTI